jgi:1-phosphatidylinositol-4-phosphate 5-kinase
MQTTSNLTRLRNNTALTAHRLKKTEGKMVFFGDAQWNLVLNMMIGIQMAIKSIQGYTGPPADFRLKYYFELIPKRFAGDKLRNNVAICKFTDYAPNTFSYIRRQFGITNDEYLKSIGPDRLLASLVMGEMASMTSLTS